MTTYTADRKGHVTENDSFQDRFLEKMYGSAIGRALLKPLVNPVLSEIGGRILDSRVSVYPISENCHVKIKHTSYTVAELLKNPVLAKRYEGGLLWVFRLCVDDYHRYIYIDDGFESRRVHIPGELHTVNPVANDVYPIYKENTREYALLKTVNFGTVLMMEVGALMVGRIENVPLRGRVKRGKEKGNFAFGGSTVILMTQKERVLPDPDIFMNSEKGIETRVNLGERIGVSEVLDG